MLKCFKKGIALLLTFMMLVSVLPSAVFADDNTVNTSLYDITVADAYQSFVVVLPDSIAVFSSTNDKISSADLASAISASGYKVSYAAENGGEDATTDAIYGGYVKLTPSSEGEAVYIPIVIKAPMNDTSFSSMTQPGDVQNVSYSSTGAPVGGKTTSSPTFTVTGTPSGYTAFKSSSLLQYNDNASLPTVWTYEFNIYADGAAVPMISLKYADDYGAYIGLKWLADGTLSGYRGGAATVFNFGTMERGKWHRVAISFVGATGGTLSNGRYNLYVDGKYVENMYTYNCNYAGDHMLFSVHPSSGAGTVAFDDLDAYAGAFEKNGGATYAITPANTDTLTFDTTAKTISYKESYTDVAVLAAAINNAIADAESVALFKSDLSAQASDIADADIAVIKSAGGAYHYYSLTPVALTGMEKVALEEVASDEPTVNNKKIEILDESVAVFSHISAFPGRYITPEILFDTIHSENGYTLSWAATDGGESSCINTITGGYIKADKDGEESIYIPIVSKTNEKVLDVADDGGGDAITNAFNYDGGTGSVKRDGVNGFGVKATSDKVKQLSVTTVEQGLLRLTLHGNMKADGSYKTNDETTYTYVFNFMTDNYLSPSVYAASNTLVSFDADGYLNYLAVTSSSNSMITTSYKIEKNKWHQLAITIDCDRKRPLIFLDGKYIGCDDAYLATMDKVAICISKTQEGTVYYDDVVYYEGYYRNDDEVVTPSKEISNIAIDTYNDIISYANVTDVAALKAAIKAQCNANTVEIYNSDYTEATELNNDKIVVLTSPNGLRYEYYTLANLDVSDIVFDVADDNIKASVAMFKSATSPVLYLAAYSGSELVSIDVAPVTVGGNIAEATVAYNKDLTYKAFIWDGVSPVAKEQY